MKKKIIAVTLILAMSFGLATVAFANPFAGNSNIEFIRGDVIIIDPPDEPQDPEDPDNPDDPYNWNLGGKDIEFGRHEITPAHMTYDAENVPAILIFSGDSTVQSFTVTVEINDFLLAGAVTMRDFELGLDPVDPAGFSSNSAASVLVSGTGIGSADDAATIFGVTMTGGSDFEYYAGEWEADLFVVGGSVTTAGAATAAMTWSVVHD